MGGKKARVTAGAIKNDTVVNSKIVLGGVFGRNLPQENSSMSRELALRVFGYLGNEDLYNTSLVNKLWSGLSLDEELWQF